MRQLKWHEEKLLKKTSLYDWRNDRNLADNEAMARYGVYSRQEYITYRKTTGRIQTLVEKLKLLPQDDPVRVELTRRLCRVLYDMGVIDNPLSGLEDIRRIPATRFMARRLPVVMLHLNMAQKVDDATKMVKQGHVRIGPNAVTNPATHVSRAHEDFVTWARNSAYRRKIMRYNDTIDEYDLMT